MTRRTLTPNAAAGYILAGIVGPAFLAMLPALAPTLKTGLYIMLGLMLTLSRYRPYRLLQSPYALFVAASSVSLGMSMFAETFAFESILLFGATVLVPYALMSHRYTEYIVPIAVGLCAALFVPDFLVNELTQLGLIASNGQITVRSGEIVSRYGGLFGHPFVSGIISLLGFTFCLAHLPRGRLLSSALLFTSAVLAFVNADLAGSRRHMLLIALTAGIYVATRIRLPRLGFLSGLALVIGVFAYNIAVIGTDEGNQLRAQIWLRSIDTILHHPIFGLGYHLPGTAPDTFDPNNVYVTESVLLSIGVWSGLPALLLFIFAVIWPILKSPEIRDSLYDRLSIQRYAAYFALYCALLLEFLFGGILPSLFGAVILGGLLGVLEPRPIHAPALSPKVIPRTR